MMFTRELMEKVIIALMIGAVGWLFINSLKVDPVVTAVGELKIVMIQNQKLNREQHEESHVEQAEDRANNNQQHGELSMMIYEQNARFEGYEAKLHRVMDDCTNNHDTILECQRFHDKRIYEIPFDILKDK